MDKKINVLNDFEFETTKNTTLIYLGNNNYLRAYEVQ